MDKRNNMDFKNIAGALKMGATLIAAGAAYGSISSRVSSLEQRKDYSVEVVEARVQITQLSSDMTEVKSNIAKILERLPR